MCISRKKKFNEAISDVVLPGNCARQSVCLEDTSPSSGLPMLEGICTERDSHEEKRISFTFHSHVDAAAFELNIELWKFD